MKHILLTNGMTASVDDDVFEPLSQYRWYAKKFPRSCTWYAQGTIGKGRDRRLVYMHRVIGWAMPGQRLDHKDNNGLNNTRANLRFCNQSQNRANTPTRKVTASGYRGAYPVGQRWWAGVRVNWKIIYLGCFETREEAARAYDRAALQHFGEFAVLNFPQEIDRAA